MTTTSERIALSAEREQQRFDHLVIGRTRPEPEIGQKPKGMSKAEWKVRKADLRKYGAQLLPGIEERVQLQEEYGHKQGTPETLAHLEAKQRRSGAIARLYASGAIDVDQLAAADQIATTYRAVTADAPVRTASWEARTGGGGGGDAEIGMLNRTMGDFAMEWWLRRVGHSAEALIAVIVQDVGLTIVADRHGMSMPKARRMIGDALSLWWNEFGRGRLVAS